MSVLSRSSIETPIREYFRLLVTLDKDNRRDLDAILSLFHEDIVWEIPFLQEPITMKGRDSVRAFMEKGQGVATDIRFEVIDFQIDEEQGRAAVQLNGSRRLVNGDIPYSNRYVFVFHMKEGRIARLYEFANPLLAAAINKALAIK